MNPETRICQNCKRPFTIEPEDFVFYEKINVPPPTFCPECRLIRRCLFRNERVLYRKRDDISGKEIFSWVSPHVPIKIYEKDYWWSDAWDPMDYGRNYDFSRPFFEQFKELMYAVPWASRNISNAINSDYSNNAYYLKNCYLCFSTGYSEDAAYAIDAGYLKSTFDLTTGMRDELCYEGSFLYDCNRVFYSHNLEQCHNVWFSRDCVGCSDCFGSANLRNKQYHIFNKPYTREAYGEELKRIFDQGSYQSFVEVKERVAKHWRSLPYKYMSGWHNASVSGDFVSYGKNAKYCYNATQIEDSRYCQGVYLGATKDSYDYTLWGETSELMYEALQTGNACHNVKFSWNCWSSAHDVEYSVHCHSSPSYLFGCVGLKKKSYCIFNKQYSKEDYFALREKIIRHMHEMPYTDARGNIYRYGEFFPSEFSPFAYNETIAGDFLPREKDEALERGYSWHDSEARGHEATIDAKDLPDHIRNAEDSLLKEVIRCGSCGGAYRIIQMEFDFLKNMSLPLPRLCVACRHRERMKCRNPVRFYFRRCQCAGAQSENGAYQNEGAHLHGVQPCSNDFETSYAPDRPEIVYCESCYQEEIS
ncbi:MAG: hypothetical protein HY617_03860 [Candidatus Sungbacteria bacterium]|nr:hypothetical protein [Candidatus Sungbacteria bacterium]